MGDGDDDEARVADEPAPDDERVIVPVPDSSGWEFNWPGFAALALIVLVVAAVWQLGGSPDDSQADGSPQQVAASSTSTLVDPAATAPSTAAPTTTTTPTTAPTTTVAPKRQVLISGEMKPCRYGNNCLVAGFVITGFEPHPGRFLCIYPNSQTELSFNDNDVEEACLTGDAGDTITIEVDGIRSATISEQSLDGT